MGSRINRKKKNNTRLVMFAIQYPFLHSFFILFFYLFIFFIFFFFIFLLRITLFIHYLFPSFTHARVVVGNWRPSVERLIVRGAFFRLIEIRRGREKQGKVYLEGREKKEEEKKKKKKEKKKATTNKFSTIHGTKGICFGRLSRCVSIEIGFSDVSHDLTVWYTVEK